ncbi:MAG: hypothetical protein JXQ90_06725 [Cyclobacteriaceae bacterium]
MKAATVREIKYGLQEKSDVELIDICLRLSKFKKENKELLTYLLFESSDEAQFVSSVKEDISEDFEQINNRNYYWMKKTCRKVLRQVKKYIRYSGIKTTEIELLIHFCRELGQLRPSIHQNVVLQNMYNQQLKAINKAVSSLHEDLQFDYQEEISKL